MKEPITTRPIWLVSARQPPEAPSEPFVACLSEPEAELYVRLNFNTRRTVEVIKGTFTPDEGTQ